jgi:hypothetical protein
MNRSLTYRSWESMKYRCNSKKHKGAKDYHLKGITYCKRWEKFENFYKDMGERLKGETLDRLDNSKGYSKSNCRWSNIYDQNNNKITNHNLTFKGKTQSIARWAREIGINESTLRERIRTGWDVKKALTTIPLKNNKHKRFCCFCGKIEYTELCQNEQLKRSVKILSNNITKKICQKKKKKKKK